MAQQVHPQGNTIDYNFFFRVAQGLVPGWSHVRKFGSGEVKTVLTTIWSGSTEQTGLYIYPDDGGIQVQIYSTSADDSVSGAGARVCKVQGLSPNKVDFQEEFVNMNGTTPVILTKNYSRIVRVSVEDCGSLAGIANIGDIHVTDVGDNELYAHIEDSDRAFGQTSQALWTLPTSYKGWLISATGSTNGGKSTSVYGFNRIPDDTVTNTPFRLAYEVKLKDSAIVIDYPVPREMFPGHDLEFRGDTRDGSGTDQVAVQFYVAYYKVRG